MAAVGFLRLWPHTLLDRPQNAKRPIQPLVARLAPGRGGVPAAPQRDRTECRLPAHQSHGHKIPALEHLVIAAPRGSRYRLCLESIMHTTFCWHLPPALDVLDTAHLALDIPIKGIYSSITNRILASARLVPSNVAALAVSVTVASVGVHHLATHSRPLAWEPAQLAVGFLVFAQAQSHHKARQCAVTLGCGARTAMGCQENPQ